MSGATRGGSCHTRALVRRLRLIVPALLTVACAAGPAAATAAPVAHPVLQQLRAVPIGQFDRPVYVTAPPGDPNRLFVVERRGVIRVIRNGKRLRTPFLNFAKRVNSIGEERGTLSMAFAPDYRRSGLFYIAYTALNGTITVEEYRRSPKNASVALASSRRVVLTQAHPHRNHNSGQLQFGPDGKLYIGIGDGGGSGDHSQRAQNLHTLLGKILRIDPREGAALAPRGNPFLAVDKARPEMWAYGFRNPWRFSFDRATGAMAIADVGQDEVEEIDYVRRGDARGRNFGWNLCEGDQAFPPAGTPRKPCAAKNVVAPAITHRHADGYCAVIGGYMVRDRSLGNMYGRYLYGDWCQPGLRTARLGVPARLRDDRPVGLNLVALTAFGEDAGGCLYAMSLGGQVLRITAVRGDDQKPLPRPGRGKVACAAIPRDAD